MTKRLYTKFEQNIPSVWQYISKQIFVKPKLKISTEFIYSMWFALHSVNLGNKKNKINYKKCNRTRFYNCSEKLSQNLYNHYNKYIKTPTCEKVQKCQIVTIKSSTIYTGLNKLQYNLLPYKIHLSSMSLNLQWYLPVSWICKSQKKPGTYSDYKTVEEIRLQIDQKVPLNFLDLLSASLITIH